jgi:hypothetical protein
VLHLLKLAESFLLSYRWKGDHHSSQELGMKERLSGASFAFVTH